MSWAVDGLQLPIVLKLVHGTHLVALPNQEAAHDLVDVGSQLAEVTLEDVAQLVTSLG